ncbi:MAG TPA: FAD-dependent oxidoreductase [Candidatus Paceibacterota bacterium]|nr:FAD-dependent oxidoreductase [Candidatus Paceibacterota bacterium]
MPMKIVVVGAGIYGCTIALKLAEAGHTVDLMEKENDILAVTASIGVRSHRGYFYPRSAETARDCQIYAPRFEEYYPEAVVKDISNFYAIACKDSKLSGTEFIEALEKHGLPYRLASNPLIEPSAVEVCLEVPEYAYDHVRLKQIIRARLENRGVRLHLGTDARTRAFEGYGLTVIAAYAGSQRVVSSLGGEDERTYEYRLCEKAVVRLDPRFAKQSFVIMDGPFFQLEPLGRESGLFLLSHAGLSTHVRWTGGDVLPPLELERFLGRGIIENPDITRFSAFVDSARAFIPGIAGARHAGSLFAIKVVLPDKSDARRTMVREVKKNVLSVFSGKVSGSIQAAEECLSYAETLTGSHMPSQGP